MIDPAALRALVEQVLVEAEEWAAYSANLGGPLASMCQDEACETKWIYFQARSAWHTAKKALILREAAAALAAAAEREEAVEVWLSKVEDVYAIDIWPPTTEAELTEHAGLISRSSAAAGRHLAGWLRSELSAVAGVGATAADQEGR